MKQEFYGRLTTLGEQKDALAKAQAIPLVFAHMAVGDGDGMVPVPDPQRSALINETWRSPLNSLSRDPVNLSQVIAELVIPENIGGWYIRELGLYDADGDMVAIANCPETYKPLLAEGSGRVQAVRMVLIVSSAETVELNIDPSIVLATRDYADQKASDSITDHIANDDPHQQYLTKSDGQTRIDLAVAALVDASPEALNTLRELAEALNDDPHFATTMVNALAEKAELNGSATESFAVADPIYARHALNLKFADARYLKSSWIGEMFDWPMDYDPGYGILCNGAAINSVTYADLFAKLVKYGKVTLTQSYEGMIMCANHGLSIGSAVRFVTAGTLPPSLTTDTAYYVMSAGLTTHSYQVSATRDGSAVTFSAAQSGVHTAISAPYGCADDLSTFNVPNVPAGYSTVQAFGNEGATTVGEVIAHAHNYWTLPPFTRTGEMSGSGSTGYMVGSNGYTTLTSAASGGAANLAAATYVRKYIRFK